jgi:rhodanese-related sulfurtransferase
MDPHRLKAGLRQGAILLILGTALGASFNEVRTDGLRWRYSWSPSKVAVSLLDGLEEISLEQARSLHRKGQALFLDARDPPTFEEGHLPAALNIPPEEAEIFAEEALAFVEAGMQLIAYCDGEDCPLSPELARALQSNGVPVVRVFVNGWSLWRAAGYPVETGEGS